MNQQGNDDDIDPPYFSYAQDNSLREGVTMYLFSLLRSPCEMIYNTLTVPSFEEGKKAANTRLSRQRSLPSWNYEQCMHIQANIERNDDTYSLISRKESSRSKSPPSILKPDEMKVLLSNVGPLSNWGIQRRSFRCPLFALIWRSSIYIRSFSFLRVSRPTTSMHTDRSFHLIILFFLSFLIGEEAVPLSIESALSSSYAPMLVSHLFSCYDAHEHSALDQSLDGSFSDDWSGRKISFETCFIAWHVLDYLF